MPKHEYKSRLTKAELRMIDECINLLSIDGQNTKAKVRETLVQFRREVYLNDVEPTPKEKEGATA